MILGKLFQWSAMVVARRTFSGVPLERAVANLQDALKDEIRFENENYEEVEDVDAFLAEGGYQMEETPGSTKIILRW